MIGADIPSWSIVTVTYNSATKLKEFWSRDRPQHVEWIVIDNGSVDDSVDVARQLGAAKIEPVKRNLGFGVACNRGLSLAHGQYVAFANPDVSVNYESLRTITDHIGNRACLVGPQLTYPDGTPQPNGRGLPTLWNKTINRIRPPQLENNYYAIAGPGETKSVCWLMGAAVCGSKTTFQELGGWSEDFFIYYEDAELGLRAWSRNIPVELLGDAQWIHGWERATRGPSLSAWKHELKSMVKFYSRYPRMLGPERIARKQPGIRG